MVQSLNRVNTAPTLKEPQGGSAQKGQAVGPNSFQDILGRLQTHAPQGSGSAIGHQETMPLKFSAHALERMQSRGVQLPKDSVQNLETAVEKARQKGSRDSLIVMGDTAFIVSVKNNTVVTAIDKAQLREQVFTNIDSTVFV